MPFGQGEDSEAFGEVFFSPGGELGLAFAVVFYEFLETLLGMGAIVGIENHFDVRDDLTFQMLLGDVLETSSRSLK